METQTSQLLVGCRTGDACPFIHDPSRLKDASNASKPRTRPQHGAVSTLPGNAAGSSKQTEAQNVTPAGGPSSSLAEGRRFIPPSVDGSRVVSRPVPKAQTEDPREFQIKQLKRRFSPTEKIENAGTSYAFLMPPSDPDFPFEIVELECVLHVPTAYPKEARPSLNIKNKEMGRGYQINVERGFARLAENSPQSTLLGLMNSLDKRLESLLTEQKAETITIIPNNTTVQGRSVRQAQPVKPARNIIEPQPQPTTTIKPQKSFTPEQRRLASERREAETRQLEARIGRLPLFSKSSDGIAFLVPITPRKHEDLPVPLQAVNTIKLFVPLLYPLQLCRVEIQGVSREAAKNIERGFETKIKESPETTLMGHVNYLAQSMHLLATQPVEEPEPGRADVPDVDSLSVEEPASEKDVHPAKGDADDRSHIMFIPRPPEWAAQKEEEHSTDSESYGSYDSGDEDEEDGGAALDLVLESSTSAMAPERGISLSFPFLELYGIELLELLSLCITIKCERCKDTMDLSNLRNNASRSESSFKIPEVKFLLISAAARANHAPVRKRPKDSLGITAGQPLPRTGRCTHYNPRKYKRRPGGVPRKIKAGGTGVVTAA
ncbi:MAG: hypothetical protein ASARMPRED_001670 [Alectoria sarmentosa]|nr:MAG: hypothetical protein ASARMPRED_001670 [Alectoria sarmentosa]